MKIFETTNYREYLKHYIAALPLKGRGEMSRIATALNISATMVSQVLSGDKDFSMEQAFTLATYLGFDSFEKDYWICLVELSRAGTKELALYWEEKAATLKRESYDAKKRIRSTGEISEEQKNIYYSHSLFIAIRLFCSIRPRRVEDIEQRFRLTRSEAHHFLGHLKDMGLVEKNNHDYSTTPKIIFLDKKSPQIYRNHTNWRIQSLKQLERPKENDLSFTFPMSISKKDFVEIRKRLVAEMMEVRKALDSTEPETIAFLNLDFIEME